VLHVIVERIQGHEADELHQRGLAVALGKERRYAGGRWKAPVFYHVAGQRGHGVAVGVGAGLLAQGQGLLFG
jgi:hypothetical protein